MMNYRCCILVSVALAGLLSHDCYARGGGGGNRGGGGASRGGGGGGGFNGGVRPSSPAGAGNMGARGAGNPRPEMNGGARSGGGSNGFNQPATSQRSTASGNRSASSQGASANRFNAPNQSQLSGFLGMPSDEGLSHAGSHAQGMNSSSAVSSSSSSSRSNNLDVNYGTKQGPNGGQAAGVTVTGQNGNTIGRAAAVGPNGGVAVAGGAQGANGATAARGAAVGPNGQVVAGRGAVGPNGYGGGSAVTSGPAGVAAGYTRVTPSGRYTTAAAVRGNYNNWGIYGAGWNVQYPGAWVATGLAAGAVWNTATWGTASAYCGYATQEPVYYDYGNSVVYQDDNVYVNGQSAGTAEQYYAQAASLASTGSEAKASSDGDWLPLGVFALTKPDAQKSDVNIQLAVSKDGIIRGNYTDTVTNKNQVVQGSVDKQTQRVAFTVGDNTTNIIETGLYNLTKDESPALIHFGNERTEQWLLVRLDNPDTNSN